MAYMGLHRLRAVALRYFNVYGPRQRFDEYGNVIPIFAAGVARGDALVVFGDGEQTRDFIHVEDVARVNALALESATAVGSFNLGTGTRMSINALAGSIQRLSMRKANIVHGPPRAGDVRHCTADVLFFDLFSISSPGRSRMRGWRRIGLVL